MRHICKIAFACGYFGAIGLVLALSTIKLTDKILNRVAKKAETKEKSGE